MLFRTGNQTTACRIERDRLCGEKAGECAVGNQFGGEPGRKRFVAVNQHIVLPLPQAPRQSRTAASSRIVRRVFITGAEYG